MGLWLKYVGNAFETFITQVNFAFKYKHCPEKKRDATFIYATYSQ